MRASTKTLSLFLTATLLIGGAFFHPVSAFTQDLGRHILTGEIIVKTLSIPRINLYSYTHSDFPFINHHWFSEVIFYTINSFFGTNGLLIFSTSIVVLSLLILIWFNRSQSFLALFIAIIFYVHILQDRTDIRPEIFSYLLLSVFIVTLYSFKKKVTRFIYVLPFLQLIWTNTHIYFPIGIAVLGLFFIDNIIENKKEFFKNKLPFSTKILFIVLGLSSLATLLNPNGVHGAIYPFTVFNNYGYSIEENQTLFFIWNYSQKPTIVWIVSTMTILIFSFFFSFKKIKPIDILLSIFFVYLSFSAIRNFPLFVFGTFSIFTYYFSSLIEKAFSEKIKLIQSFLIPKILFALLPVVIVIWQFNQLSSIRGVGMGEFSGAKNAADFYIAQNLKGPIFNNFDIGSYIEYRMYPREKVFIDGRPEAYPKDFIQKEYIPMQQDPQIFKQLENKYKFNTIFFSHTDQTPWATEFLKSISTASSWKKIYLDEYVVIYVKDTQQNKKIISAFSNDNISHYDPTNNTSLYRLLLYFEKTDQQAKAIPVYKDLLKLEPKNCYALYNLVMLKHEETTYAPLLNLNCR